MSKKSCLKFKLIFCSCKAYRQEWHGQALVCSIVDKKVYCGQLLRQRLAVVSKVNFCSKGQLSLQRKGQLLLQRSIFVAVVSHLAEVNGKISNRGELLMQRWTVVAKVWRGELVHDQRSTVVTEVNSCTRGQLSY